MQTKLYLLFSFYKRHFYVLTFVTLLLLFKEKNTTLAFIILIKFVYFLGLKIWHKLVSYTNMEVSFTDRFFFYENLGLHNLHLFLFGFLFDSIASVMTFYSFQYFIR